MKTPQYFQVILALTTYSADMIWSGSNHSAVLFFMPLRGFLIKRDYLRKRSVHLGYVTYNDVSHSFKKKYAYFKYI